MKLTSTYKIRISTPFTELVDTIRVYRQAVGFFINLINNEWELLEPYGSGKNALNMIEALSITTKNHPNPKYHFEQEFYKFPSYLRRSALCGAYGLVSSYRSNLRNWEETPKDKRGQKPSIPVAGNSFPVMYRDNCFIRTGENTAEIKVRIRNTWDWIKIKLRNTDVKYIQRHCAMMKECAPVLVKRGKVWTLDFSFEQSVKLKDKKNVKQQKILAVDLGLINACTCCVMDSEGTVSERQFFKLSEEYDSLDKAMERIKRALRAGWHRMPSLWARLNGINEDISRKTAKFIADLADKHDVDTVVMEQLHLQGKKYGGKKWRLHMWKAKKVQEMVTHKCHASGRRVSFVYAAYSSRYAFDGSGEVLRGKDSFKTKGNYSLCEFKSGKVYNCDLNASYNIGARYFIREFLNAVSDQQRADYVAKVQSVGKRSTCTLSSLKDLRRVMSGLAPLVTERVTSDETRDSDAPSRATVTEKISVTAVGCTRL